MQNISANSNDRDQLDTFIDGTTHAEEFRRLAREELLSNMPEMQTKHTKPHAVRTLNAFLKDCIKPQF